MNGYIADLYVANAKKIQSPEGSWDTLEVTISKIVNVCQKWKTFSALFKKLQLH